MAVQTTSVPPMDPYGITGPVRTLGVPCRFGTVTLDAYYGVDNQPEVARWISVGTAGSISFTAMDGTDHDMPVLVAGVWHPMATIKINSSGTTVTGIRWAS